MCSAELAAVLPRAWRADTAWIDDWSARNPARGQCGSTALVLQDLCGGSLVGGIVEHKRRGPIVHYWNAFGPRRIDLTWQQFPRSARVVREAPIERSELLRESWFCDRYRALRTRVDALLDQANSV